MYANSKIVPVSETRVSGKLKMIALDNEDTDVFILTKKSSVCLLGRSALHCNKDVRADARENNLNFLADRGDHGRRRQVGYRKVAVHGQATATKAAEASLVNSGCWLVSRLRPEPH